MGGLGQAGFKIRRLTLAAINALYYTKVQSDARFGGLAAANAWTDRNDLKTVTEVVTAANITGALTIDCALSEVKDCTLTGTVTSIAFSNVPATGKAFTLTLFLRQSGAGSFLMTWPASVKWPSGTAPTLSTAAGKCDVITLVTLDGGTTWFGFIGGLTYTP